MGKVTARHVEGRTREQRVAVRKKLGPLKTLTAQSKTKTRYDSARQGFYAFLRQNRLVLPLPRDDLGPIVSEYIEHLWSSGEGRAKANDTVAGLQDIDPKLSGQLPSSWRLLKTWSLNEIPNRASPLTESIVQAMAGYAFKQKQFTVALSLLVGFYCMLRTGELVGLHSNHISLSSPRHVAVRALGLTKGRKRQGAAESVTLGVMDVLALLWQWKQTQRANTPLCPSPHRWRALLSQTVKALKLDSMGFRPYSLRRGGATHWFRHHGNLDKLIVQGRWAAPRTAKVYINEGLAVIAEFKIPEKILRPFVKEFNQTVNSCQKLEQPSAGQGRAPWRVISMPSCFPFFASFKTKKCTWGLGEPRCGEALGGTEGVFLLSVLAGVV